MNSIKLAWAMPSKHTFTIKPIRELIRKYVVEPDEWADPFCGEHSPATIWTNDLNPANGRFTMDAVEFINTIVPWGLQGILFDPPYSPRQMAECYHAYGMEVTWETTQARWWSMLKDRMMQLAPGLVISCGWDGMGMGVSRGYEMIDGVVVRHGGVHTVTVVTVEKRVESEVLTMEQREAETWV